MAPEPVISYVIIHELAHLREMNHTKKFWKLVAHHCPRWREQRKWLKDHQTEFAAKLLGACVSNTCAKAKEPAKTVSFRHDSDITHTDS